MKAAVLTTKSGVAINLFEQGAVTQPLANGNTVDLTFDTKYPAEETVKITVDPNCTQTFEILIRNPEWSLCTKASVNGEEIPATKGYISICRDWAKGDEIEITFDMRAKAIYPIPYGSLILMNKTIWGANYMVSTFDREHPDTKNHIAIQRGPLMLAQENRLGYSVDDAVSVKVTEDGYVDVIIPDRKTAPYPCEFEAMIPTTDGSYFTVTDYASAGKLWNNESRLAVWMNTK